MVSTQIERLQQDSSQLQLFIEELRQKGDIERMNMILEKKAYLDNRLGEIMS